MSDDIKHPRTATFEDAPRTDGRTQQPIPQEDDDDDGND